MDPFFHTGLSISDSLKTVRKSVLIYETIIGEEAPDFQDAYGDEPGGSSPHERERCKADGL